MLNINERDVIDKIINEESVELLSFVNEDDFNTCKSFYGFIKAYEAKNKRIPNEAVMKLQFNDFKLGAKNDVNIKDFLYAFKAKKGKNTLIKTIEDIVNNSDEDSFKIASILEEKMAEFTNGANIKAETGYDIIANIEDRKEKHLAMKNPEEKKKIISFGLRGLDSTLLGIEQDDYISIIARPNIGKSWIAEYFGVEAWRQGKKVLMYSGEMDVDSMGYRFDTLFSKFSNFGLRSGGDDLGAGKTTSDYVNYALDLRNKDGFVVVTPNDFGGKRPSMKDIERVVKEHEPDLIILDQMSLLSDYRRANNIREQYNNISTDILTFCNTKKLPIILVAQANRGADQKGKDKDGTAPELNEIMESDKIGQDSKKVFSLAVKDGILSIVCKKGRNGGKDTEVKLNWDIDKGILKPLLDDENVENVRNDYGF